MKTRSFLLEPSGFTLIETMIAMAIFTIGILGLFGMQTAAIKENLAANNITTGTTWASDQVEKLIGRSYNDNDLLDDDSDGCNGLNHRPLKDDGSHPEDGYVSEDATKLTPPIYKIYWNVAEGCTLTKGNIQTAGFRTKHLRIIVTIDNGNGAEEEVSVVNYITRND